MKKQLNPNSVSKFNLPAPRYAIESGKTLFVEKVPSDFPPDLLAAHLLRAAINAGCEIISVKQGSARYEFRVQDIVPKEKILELAALDRIGAFGPSALSLKLSGYEFDRMAGPQSSIYVKPPWNSPEALAQEKTDGSIK